MSTTPISRGEVVGLPEVTTEISQDGGNVSVTWISLAKPADGAHPPGGVPESYVVKNWRRTPNGPGWTVDISYRDTAIDPIDDSWEISESIDETGKRTVTARWTTTTTPGVIPTPPIIPGFDISDLVLISQSKTLSSDGVYTLNLTYSKPDLIDDPGEAPVNDPSNDSISYTTSYEKSPKADHPLWDTTRAACQSSPFWDKFCAGDMIKGPPNQNYFSGIGLDWEWHIPGTKMGGGDTPVRGHLNGENETNASKLRDWIKTGAQYKITVITKSTNTRYTKTLPDTGTAPGMPSDIEATLDNGNIGAKTGDWTYMGGSASTADLVGQVKITIPASGDDPETTETRNVWSWDIQKSWEKRIHETIESPVSVG